MTIAGTPTLIRRKTMQSKLIVTGMLLLLGVGVWAQENSVEVEALLEAVDERVPLQTAVPAYPEKALRERIQGVVEVCFNVDRAGRPLRIAVRKSSHRVFEKPAMQAVKDSSYHPLEDHEILSGIKTCRTFRFQLDPVAIDDPRETSVDSES